MALRQKEIGARLASLRERRRLTQEAAAAGLKVSYRALQKWEAGDARPVWRNLERLAEFYGVSEEYILSGSEQPPTPEGQLDRIEAKVDELRELIELITATRSTTRTLAEGAEGESADAGTPGGAGATPADAELRPGGTRGNADAPPS